MPISNIILQKCLCFIVLPAQTENQAPAQSFPRLLLKAVGVGEKPQATARKLPERMNAKQLNVSAAVRREHAPKQAATEEQRKRSADRVGTKQQPRRAPRHGSS